MVRLPVFAVVTVIGATVPVVLQQRALVHCEHSVHLLSARHFVLKVALHLVDVQFEVLQEREHLLRVGLEAQDLLILIIDRLLGDVSDKAEVLLDPVQEVLGAQARKQGELALEIEH